MANSQWGKMWYQAPTEITRNNKIYYFIGNIENGCGTFTQAGVKKLKQVAREHNIGIRILCRTANLNVSEIWATNKHLNDLANAEEIPYTNEN